MRKHRYLLLYKALSITILFGISLVTISCSSQKIIYYPMTKVELVTEDSIQFKEVSPLPFISRSTTIYTSRQVEPNSLFLRLQDFTSLHKEDLRDLYHDSLVLQKNFYLQVADPQMIHKWQRIIDLYPSHEPIYQTADGNIYFVGYDSSLYTNFLNSYQYDTYNNCFVFTKEDNTLLLLSPNGEELPLKPENDSFDFSSYHVKYCKPEEPWIILQQNQTVNNTIDSSSLWFLQLETQSLYPLPMDNENVIAVHSVEHGYVIETATENIPIVSLYENREFQRYQSNTNYIVSTHSRHYYYLNVNNGTIHNISSPTDASVCYAHSLSSFVLWYDQFENTLYGQDLSFPDRSHLLTDSYSAYSINSFQNGAWILPSQDENDSWNKILLIKCSDSIISMQEYLLPVVYYKNQGLYVDQHQNFTFIANQQGGYSLYVISPLHPSVIHEYPMNIIPQCDSLQIFQSINSAEGVQRIKSMLTIPITGENTHENYDENVDPSNGDHSSSKLSRDFYKATMLEYKLPDSILSM